MTIKEWQQKFSSKTKELMKRNNMTQSQLAMKSEVSAGRLNEYINMKSMPTIFAIINIADAFDISIGELIDFGERIE